MLYHAFNKEYDVFVGREGVIEELKAGADGWPVLHNSTVANRPKEELDFYDNFKKDKKLSLVWQWPSKLSKPQMSFKDGLELTASNENHDLGTFLGQYIKTVNFSVTSDIEVTDAKAGVCFGGAIAGSKWPGELGGIGIAASREGLTVFNNLDKQYVVLKQSNEKLSGPLSLKMQVAEGAKRIDFYYKKQGSEWIKFYTTPFNASKYAPWGMGYRAGIVAKADGGAGLFKSFELKND